MSVDGPVVDLARGDRIDRFRVTSMLDHGKEGVAAAVIDEFLQLPRVLKAYRAESQWIDRLRYVVRAFTDLAEVPGMNDKGEFDGQQMRDWIVSARTLARDFGRDEIADSQIGQLLAHSPVGSDGFWPHEAVRKVLEDLGTDRLAAHAQEQDRPDILSRRHIWFDSQLDIDPERLVFIDETWASTNMARRHGRTPRDERLRISVPHGHWKTTTFVAALRSDGLIAPFVLDRPINRDAFEVYVEQVLAPELCAGDVGHP